MNRVLLRNIFLFFLSIIISLEIGLRLNQVKISLTKNKNSKDREVFKILFLGDSITGQGENTYPTLVGKILEKNTKKKIHIKNLSKPGLTSTQLLSHLEEQLRIQRPHLTIVMLGKSDFIKSLPLEKQAYLKSKVLKLLNFNIKKSKKKIFLMYGWLQYTLYKLNITPLSKVQYSYLHSMFWDGFLKRKVKSNNDCLSYGDNILVRHISKKKLLPKRIIKALFLCFIDKDKTNQGLKYFEKLISQRAKNTTALEHLTYFYLLEKEWAKARKIILSLPRGKQESTRTKLHFSKAILGKVVISKRLKKDNFGIDLSTSFPTNPKTIKNLNHIKDIIMRYKSKVLFMQYPSEKLISLQNAFNKSQQFIYDTRQKLEQSAISNNILDIHLLFQRDFEHLTIKGHIFLAQKLSEFIINQQLNKSINNY